MKEVIKDIKQKNIKRICLLITMIILIFITLGFFVMGKLDFEGCNGMFGGLSGECHSLMYQLAAYILIIPTLFSIIGLITNNKIVSNILLIPLLVLNIYLLTVTTTQLFQKMEKFFILFIIIIFIINYIIPWLLIRTNRKKI